MDDSNNNNQEGVTIDDLHARLADVVELLRDIDGRLQGIEADVSDIQSQIFRPES